MCEQHRQRWRRHGDPTQTSIRKSDVAPFKRRARKIVQRDSTGKVKEALQEIHAILVEHTRSVAADAGRGGWVPKWSAQAAHETHAVLLEADPVECALTVAGVFLLRAHKPYLFESDRGLTFQLVRLFRAQCALAYGSYFDPRVGRAKKTYKDLPPRVVERMGVMLTDAYARFVGHVQRLERAQLERLEGIKESLDAGFAGCHA